MIIRILSGVGDPDTARALTTLLGQLPATDPGQVVTDSTALLNTLGRLAEESIEELPEVVLVHERIGPVPALELIREIAMRFPAAGVVLMSQAPTPDLYSAAMDSGARGVVGLPLSYDELASRVQAAAAWSSGVRRHLSPGGTDYLAGPGGSLLTVTGAKGGVGTTVTAVQLALAARAAGRATALVDMDLQAGDLASYLEVTFRRSIADLSEINEVSPRVLQDAMFTHPTGLALLLAPAEGERGEDITDRAARQVISALRARFEVVVVDCGTQMNGANAVAVEMADTAVLVVTPDVVAVRAAKRMVRMWDRLQIRKAEETTLVVNRHTRGSEIQPALVERITGTKAAKSVVPAGFKDLQPVIDAGRLQDLDARSPVKQALWALAGELGIVRPPRASSGGRGGAAGAAGAPGAPSAPGTPGTPSKELVQVRGGSAVVPQPGRQGRSGRQRRALKPVKQPKPPKPPKPHGRRGRYGDQGQVSLEFLGITPLVVTVLLLIWQCVLVGYTFTLAGNAADEAARAAAAARPGGQSAACDRAAKEDLPGAWQGSYSGADCSTSNGVVTSKVKINVPVIVPGIDIPVDITGEAGAAEEEG